MPKISQHSKGGTIIFDGDDFIGFSPQGGKTAGRLVKSSPGFSYAQNLDQYRDIGYIQPGLLYSTATLATTQLANSYGVGFAIDNSDEGYILTDAGKVLQYNYTTNALTNAGNYPHTIAHGAHTTFSGKDCIIYQHNVGGVIRRDLFYSFNDNTDWDVGVLNPANDTFDDDYMSVGGVYGPPATPLAGADLTYGKDYPHPMAIGSDDVLYIGSGRYLHGYDGGQGAEGTFQAKVLTLPAGFIITCLLSTGTNLLIGGIYANTLAPLVSPLNNEAKVYVWNYLDQDITYNIPCDDGYISSLINYRGIPTAITAGYVLNRGGIRIKVLTGDYFNTIAELPTSIPPLFRGVDSVANQMFINADGKIYTVGSPFSNDYEVNQPVAASNSGDSGFIKNVFYATSSNRNLISSSTADLSVFRSGFSESASFYSTKAEPLFPNLQQGRITHFIVYYKGTSTAGRSIRFILVNETGNQILVLNDTTEIAEPLIKKYEISDYDGKPLPFFKDISVLAVWGGGDGSTSCPIISKIQLNFEYVAYQDGQQT